MTPETCLPCLKAGVTTPMQVAALDTRPAQWVMFCPVHPENIQVLPSLAALEAENRRLKGPVSKIDVQNALVSGKSWKTKYGDGQSLAITAEICERVIASRASKANPPKEAGK